MSYNSDDYFWKKIENKEELKKEFIEVTFFISLYENFKKNWEEEILAFYANSFSMDDEQKVIYEFTKPNPNNPKAFEDNDFVYDKFEEEKYKREVYRTVKKKNGKDWDHEASLFNWLYTRGIIEKEHYDTLLRIRTIRNQLVHELDKMLFSGLPEDLSTMLKKLIEIRKFSSKEWFIQVELPTSGEAEFDNEGNVILPDNVFSGPDIIYDIIYDTVLK